MFDDTGGPRHQHARHASNTLSLWIVSGNPPPNLVCLYICLHFNDKENEVHSNWEQILFYQVKNQSLLLLPLLQWFLKCYLLLASASLFFFFQVKCWMPKSPYSPAPQTEMGWTELLVSRAGSENTSAIIGQSVSRKKRSFWVSYVQWLPLCRGYSQLWTECAVISKAFWPRSSEAQVSWSHLRAANQEHHLLQGEKSGLREVKRHARQYPARSWPSWKPEFEIPDPLVLSNQLLDPSPKHDLCHDWEWGGTLM